MARALRTVQTVRHSIRVLSPLGWAFVASMLILALCYVWAGWEVHAFLTRLYVPLASGKIH